MYIYVCVYVCREERFLSARILIKSNSGDRESRSMVEI